MDPEGPTSVQAALVRADEVSVDLRANRRYPIRLEVEYKLLSEPLTGFGVTLNVSSGGILFETENRLPDYGSIEMSLKWPFLLDGGCALKLVMRGRIVRSDETSTAVKITQHEFRTAGLQRAAAG